VPSLDPALWPAQVGAASKELAARAAKLEALAAGFTRAGATAECTARS